jgi:hypothetical protein
MYDGRQSSVLCAVLCVEENDCDVKKGALNCIEIDCFEVHASPEVRLPAQQICRSTCGPNLQVAAVLCKLNTDYRRFGKRRSHARMRAWWRSCKYKSNLAPVVSRCRDVKRTCDLVYQGQNLKVRAYSILVSRILIGDAQAMHDGTIPGGESRVHVRPESIPQHDHAVHHLTTYCETERSKLAIGLRNRVRISRGLMHLVLAADQVCMCFFSYEKEQQMAHPTIPRYAAN